MSAYTRGNLAIQEAVRHPAPQKRIQPQKQPSRKSLRLTSGEKLFYLFCGLIITAALSSVVLLSSKIYYVNKATQETEASIQTAAEEGGQLKTELDKALNPENLLGEAERSGFKNIGDEQKTTSNAAGSTESAAGSVSSSGDEG